MGHNHTHAGNGDKERIRSLKLVLGIIAVITIAEVLGGIFSGSLALLGDAGHMLVDALALGLSLFAIIIARRPADAQKTYGYHRAEIMAALVNGMALILVSAYIFYEAYRRFNEPLEIHTSLMLIVAAVGLTANLASIYILRKTSRHSLNIRAAFWHIIGDTMSSVGVIIAAIVIAVTGWYYADPLIAVIIGCVILWGAVRLVREAADILLEAVPGHISLEEVIDELRAGEGVTDVHDIHIWTITSGIYALSAHISIEDQQVSRSADIIKAANEKLGKKFSITHTTLQLECEHCPTGLVCVIHNP